MEKMRKGKSVKLKKERGGQERKWQGREGKERQEKYRWEQKKKGEERKHRNRKEMKPRARKRKVRKEHRQIQDQNKETKGGLRAANSEGRKWKRDERRMTGAVKHKKSKRREWVGKGQKGRGSREGTDGKEAGSRDADSPTLLPLFLLNSCKPPRHSCIPPSL